MIKVEYSTEAKQDLIDIFKFISKDGEEIARSVVKRIKKTANALIDTPSIGTRCDVRYNVESNLKFLISPPYIIYFEWQGDTAYIVTVLDGRRDVKNILFQSVKPSK